MANEVSVSSVQEYLGHLKKRINWVEELTSHVSGLDERLDVTNILLMEMLQLLGHNLDVVLQVNLPQLEREGVDAPRILPERPDYNVRDFSLDNARASPGEEVSIPGDFIAAETDGSLVGIFARLERATNDAIPLSRFNALPFPFKRFYLTSNAQTGKTLNLFIARLPIGTISAGFGSLGTQKGEVSVRQNFITIRSDKDNHFTGALATNAQEVENLTGLSANRLRITGLSLQADQNLHFVVLLWAKDTFDDTDLDSDTFIAEVDVDLSAYGRRIGAANQYYLDVENLNIPYRDDDSSYELHVSLLNVDATSKNVGATGEVVLEVFYEVAES